MNYNETLAYLYRQLPMFQRIGAAAYKADLSNTISLNNIFGNPQNDFPSVHIAGTNGKGSVAHMLASVLQECGYRTGLYTSPHLKDFRERIRIDGIKIEKDFITAFVEKYKNAFEPLKPSFFELTFCMAMLYFRDNNIDIAVVETGMGGRLDSTNTVSPVLSIITNISFDHMQFLGNTLGKIAAEKAGIIKAGVPVVIGETSPETRDVFIDTANRNGAPISFADQQYITEITHKTEEGRIFSIKGKHKSLADRLLCPLSGNYQRKNLATVFQAAEILNDTGWKVETENVKKGIEKVKENTGIAGRWHILGKDPLIVCDMAHNAAGLQAVMEQIKGIPFEKLHAVIGFVNDKDLLGLLTLMPGDATYYFCKPDVPRGLDSNTLFDLAKENGLHGQVYPTVRRALEEAKKNASAEDMIFIGGSTFVVAEVV